MNFELSEDDAMFVDSVRQLGRDRIAPQATAWDDAGRIPDEVLGELGQLGLLGMAVPEDQGGVGLSAVATTAIVDQLAQASASAALVLSVHNFLAVGHVLRAGTAAQRSAWLATMTTGPGVVGWALGERAAGSDLAATQTAARRTDGGWTIDGAKAYVTAGAHAQAFVVVAATDAAAGGPAGLTAFLVDADAPGLRVAERVRPLGMRGAALAHLELASVQVTDDRRLGGVGEALADVHALLDRSRIGMAAIACGIVSAALTAAADYAQQREQFGQPIAGFQAIQWKLADMAVGLDAARALTMRAAWLCDAGRPFADAASRAKLFAGELATRACSEALQIHGGYGYTHEFVVERLLRDAKATQLSEGTSQIQRLLLSRSLLARLTA